MAFLKDIEKNQPIVNQSHLFQNKRQYCPLIKQSQLLQDTRQLDNNISKSNINITNTPQNTISLNNQYYNSRNNSNNSNYSNNSNNTNNTNNNSNNMKNRNVNNIFNIYKKNLFDIGIKSQEEIKTNNYQTYIKTNKNNKHIPHLNPKPFTHFSHSTFEDRLNNPSSFGPLSKRYKMAQLKQFLEQNAQRQEMKNIIEEDLHGLFNFY